MEKIFITNKKYPGGFQLKSHQLDEKKPWKVI